MTMSEWGYCTCMCVLSSGVLLQDYELAAEVFKSLAVQLPSLKADIYAGIGRIYLQVGFEWWCWWWWSVVVSVVHTLGL